MTTPLAIQISALCYPLYPDSIQSLPLVTISITISNIRDTLTLFYIYTLQKLFD